jgi:eukaryotic-like serine/threonine-protein kinase
MLSNKFKIPMTSASRTNFGRYEIISPLGKGGMGEVFLARDAKLERKVAIKMLSGEIGNASDRLRRFSQEAKAASALNHPNILTVYEIGETPDGTHFIVTEYIDGRTLKRYLAEEKPPLQEILKIAVQIAAALAAAHDAGIIHRDIKPENIMIRPDGIVKILDFGVAKLTAAAAAAEAASAAGQSGEGVDAEAATRAKAMTVPGMIIGTPQYMSPEQARGQKIDARTDIFSFGSLLYEMIAGRPPFSGVNEIDVIGSVLKDEPKPLSAYLPEISRDLEHIVAKTLRKDREQRYQHIKDLCIDLNDVKKTLEFEPNPSRHQTDSAGEAPTTVHTAGGMVAQKRFSLLHAIVFLFVAGAITASAWWFFASPGGGGGQIESPLKTAEVVSWASTPGEVYSAGTFSPDGKMVAFSSTKAGPRNIWIKQTASGEAVQITKDEFANEQPIWAPNGEELAFISARGNQRGVWRIPILGGSPKLVTLLEDGSSILRLWSKTDLIYYESRGEIFAVEAASGQSRPVTDLNSTGIRAASVNISPDERRVVYTTVEERQWSVWTKDTDAEASKKLFASAAGEIKNTVFHPDGRRIFFSALTDGILQIFVTDRDGAAAPKQITFAERDCLISDVSSDGAKILYGSAKEESDIWRVNLESGRETIVASDIASELWASVAPDGKTVAYQSIKHLSQGNNLFSGEIVTKKLDSAEQQPPMRIADQGGLPVWSPDGQKIAFMQIAGNKYQISIINPATGGQKHLAAEDADRPNHSLLPYSRIQTSDFSWSPDNARLAYTSRRSGHSNIWLAGADGADNTQLTSNTDPKLYYYCPLWSADGKRVAFTSRTGGSAAGKAVFAVWLVDAESKDLKQLTRQDSFARLIGWTPKNDALILASVAGGGTSGLQAEVFLLRLEIETGRAQPLATLKDSYLYNIHLAPDGKTIAFAAHREGRDNLWLIPASGGGEEKKLTNNNDSRLYFSSLAWSPDGGSIFFGKQSRYSLLSMLTNFK